MACTLLEENLSLVSSRRAHARLWADTLYILLRQLGDATVAKQFLHEPDMRLVAWIRAPPLLGATRALACWVCIAHGADGTSRPRRTEPLFATHAPPAAPAAPCPTTLAAIEIPTEPCTGLKGQQAIIRAVCEAVTERIRQGVRRPTARAQALLARLVETAAQWVLVAQPYGEEEVIVQLLAAAVEAIDVHEGRVAPRWVRPLACVVHALLAHGKNLLVRLMPWIKVDTDMQDPQEVAGLLVHLCTLVPAPLVAAPGLVAPLLAATAAPANDKVAAILRTHFMKPTMIESLVTPARLASRASDFVVVTADTFLLFFATEYPLVERRILAALASCSVANAHAVVVAHVQRMAEPLVPTAHVVADVWDRGNHDVLRTVWKECFHVVQREARTLSAPSLGLVARVAGLGDAPMQALCAQFRALHASLLPYATLPTRSAAALALEVRAVHPQRAMAALRSPPTTLPALDGRGLSAYRYKRPHTALTSPLKSPRKSRRLVRARAVPHTTPRSPRPPPRLPPLDRPHSEM